MYVGNFHWLWYVYFQIHLKIESFVLSLPRENYVSKNSLRNSGGKKSLPF